jgi:hypothetical protein
MALVAEALDRPDQALDLLERAHANRANMLVLMRVEPRWDRLRSHPRFQDLERRMAFPPAPAALGAPAAPAG